MNTQTETVNRETLTPGPPQAHTPTTTQPSGVPLLTTCLSTKVRGKEYAKGQCASDSYRITINNKLLVCVPPRGRPYAPVTRDPLIKTWGEYGPNCNFIGTHPPGEDICFIKEGVLLSPYKLDSIAH